MLTVAKTFSQSHVLSREMEVLSHILSGHSNKIIAQALGVTEAAAKVQLESLLRKINVDNRTQATIWALKNLPEALAALSLG
jgi:DNA-binding NarL/FixJ family response regulator